LQISGPDICCVILCNERYSFYITARGPYNYHFILNINQLKPVNEKNVLMLQALNLSNSTHISLTQYNIKDGMNNSRTMRHSVTFLLLYNHSLRTVTEDYRQPYLKTK